ncbi:MAG: polysaccharide biosynthesis C-terminal domain-containing protein [Clostridia bacterium]|nr:polysaccharide biosynthesis C-terminal domain-containing protein [Clostridia bacterium]
MTAGVLQENKVKGENIFGQIPVLKAVLLMAIPTVVSQLISVLYNIADTWFLGVTENTAAVAAVSLCLPLYVMMAAFANLFGIGGASVIARALGEENKQKAQKAFKVSIIGSLIFSVIYALILIVFSNKILMLIGGDAENIQYAYNYTLITIIIGSIPTIISMTLAHLIRATGQSKIASFGMVLGAVLNIALDPLFMFVIFSPGSELIGASIATLLSNVISFIFFVVYITLSKNEIFKLKQEKNNEKVILDILKCGAASFCLKGISMISNCFLNGMLTSLGASSAMAGIGITRKIDSVAYAINQGITQGMLPIVSYCYASKKYDRMKKVIIISAAMTMGFSVLWALMSYIFAPYLIEFFINDLEVITLGTKFLRILCIAVAIYPLLFVLITVFQAVGDSAKPFILALLHKGIDIAIFFLVRSVWGVEYILYVAPTMDLIALIIAIILYLKRFSRNNLNIKKNPL